jgi:hypothetical protein
MQLFQWHGNGPFGLIQPRHRTGERCEQPFSMMLSGLCLMGFMARRRKQSAA